MARRGFDHYQTSDIEIIIQGYIRTVQEVGERDNALLEVMNLTFLLDYFLVFLHTLNLSIIITDELIHRSIYLSNFLSIYPSFPQCLQVFFCQSSWSLVKWLLRKLSTHTKTQFSRWIWTEVLEILTTAFLQSWK